jgi:hypothetical protein
MGNDHWQLPTTNVCDPENADYDVDDLNQLLKFYSRLQAHLAVLQSIYSPQQSLQGRVNVPFTTIFEEFRFVEMIRELGTILRYANLRFSTNSSNVFWRGNKLFRNIPKRYRDALQLDVFDSNGRKRSDKPELSDEDFLKKNGFPRREPGFRNAEMLQYISSFLPRKILKYFAGLSNSVVTRVKMSDPHTRAIAVSVVDAISDVFLDILTYEETKGDDIDAYLYWFCCTNFVLSVLSGGRIHSYELFSL